MKRTPAAIGSAVWFALAPGVVAGLVPWSLTGWQLRPLAVAWMPVRVLGVALVVAGAAVLLHAFVRFVVEGLGTPVPIAPPQRLVVGGLYRHVRNPMYVAVIAAVVGQALALGQFGLLWYAAAVTAITAGFVHLYEEPVLRQRFGEEYDTYRRAVGRWWPRLHPWRPMT
jgi:protein-S-isoprenylcysteine O-methyltransferase Ste14